MTQVSKNDVNQIFASNAPDQDKPPSFSNYTNGWGESRTNNGKPTIKQQNFIQQRTDQNLLWIHQNGGALPYDASIEYVDGCIVLKDDKLQRLKDGKWIPYQQKDSDIVTWNESTQDNENKSFIFRVKVYDELPDALSNINRVAYVQGDGNYISNGTEWTKDQTLNIYEFKTHQYIAYYYNIYKDWDEAIFQAQLNIYTKGLSEKLIFPAEFIRLKRPILHGGALGDYIHARYPELNFYNSETQQYKQTWSLIIEGVNNSFKDGVDLPDQAIANGDITGTQLIFEGCYGSNDKTYMNKAVIYAGYTDYQDHRNKTRGWISNYIDIRNVSIDCNNTDGSKFAMIHGIYGYQANHIYLEKVVVYRLWGAGVLLDLAYDWRVVECKILRCGRMIGTLNEFLANPKLDIAYQTYAPFHVINSANDVSQDDSNFGRVQDCQIEDNWYVPADVILSDISPTWFTNTHFECEEGNGLFNSGKTAFCLGKWGVKYLGRDSESDYAGNEDTGVGGSVIIQGGSMFSASYDHIATVYRFSNLAINNWLDPQSASISINGGDANVSAVISNSNIGGIEFGGGVANAYGLRVINTTMNGNLDINYAGSAILSKVVINGDINFGITTTASSRNDPFVFDDVHANTVKGFPNYIKGTINAKDIGGFYSYNTDTYISNDSKFNDILGYN